MNGEPGWFLLLFVVTFGRVLCESRRDVCGVTVLFNPFQHKTRVQNLLHARHWWRRQNINVTIVELIYGDHLSIRDTHPEIAEPPGELVQRRTSETHVLWQKEALLNIAFESLRNVEECTKIVWLDSDVVIEDGWIDQVSEMLDDCPIGQPFTHLVRLPRGVFNPYSYWAEPRMRRLGLGFREGQMFHSASAAVGGHTGFAWAATKEVLLSSNGLYAHAIVGGFDTLLVNALVDPKCENRLNDAMARHFEAWATSLRANVGRHCLAKPKKIVKAGTFWHGELRDRLYQERHQLLHHHGFNPLVHVRVNSQGILEWTRHASCRLRQAVYSMFVKRQESGQAVGTLPGPYECVEICSKHLEIFELVHDVSVKDTQCLMP